MGNELLKTKSDVFNFLFEQKALFFYKAQEAEDLGNSEGAAELRALAEQVGVATKRMASEKEGEFGNRSVYCLCETHEHGDAIREFEILAVSTDKEALKQLMRAKVTADEYGYLKENGIYEQSEDWISSNDNNGFVEFSISEMPVLSRQELERKSMCLDISVNVSVAGKDSPEPAALSTQIHAAESVKNDVVRDGHKPSVVKDR